MGMILLVSPLVDETVEELLTGDTAVDDEVEGIHLHMVAIL